MGILTYGSRVQQPIEFDDRTLAHLQVVIGSKLRQRQSFFLSWLESIDGGSGRGSIWIDGAIALNFAYASAQRYKINRDWVEVLMTSANSANGLQLTPEPQKRPPTADPTHVIDRSWTSAADLVRS
jgi:hypothetical protein